jgi:hypothetical protein
MDPIDLTCPKCGTAWKLIKAGDGPVTCPNCKSAIDGEPTNSHSPVSPPPTEGRSANPVMATAPAADHPPSARDLSDADDPGIGVPSRLRMPAPDLPRRGRHPLVTVAVVLLLLLLVPLALVACLFAVCAVLFRGM